MAKRASREARQRLYGPKWRVARRGHLLHHPLCVYCQRRGLLVEATDVDHIVAHRGDVRLFWDRTNWQSLCDRCSNAKSMRELHAERAGRAVTTPGCDRDGRPIDPLHPWNRSTEK